MSQKKHKKSHSQAKRPASIPVESEFSSDGKRKRMNRTARNLLIVTLILLAAVQLLIQTQLIDEALANLLSLIGLILLLSALWVQFRDPSGGSSGGGAPRLR